MNKRFLKQIFRAFEMMNRCYEGDDTAGAPGGSADDGGTADNKDGAEEKVIADPELFDGANISDELKDDPDFIKEIEELKEIEQPEKDPVKDPEKVVDKNAVKDTELKFEKENEIVYKEKKDSDGEDAIVEKVNDDGTYNIKVGDKVIENVKIDNLGKPEEPSYTYENDVTIEGMTFKKEVLQKTPVEILENLGNLITKNKELNEQITSSSTANEEILNDPIVKERMRRIEEGKGNESYATYGMSKETRKLLEETLELKEDEIIEVNKEFEKDMAENVNLAVKSILLKNKTEQESRERGKAGVDALLALGDINEAFKIKETNIEKIWEQKEKHPEWNTFNKGIGRYQKHLMEKFGYKRYEELAKFKDNPKALYAMIAADLGEPVAFNTKSRDFKIRQTERDKMLSMFNPKKLDKAMKQSKDTVKTTEKEATIVDFGAIDKGKLSDPDYVGALIDNAKDEEEIFAIQNLVKKNVRL
ncbi:MAG TPA: hypothetical protein VMV77_16755 [Bacteroidales bacterium]|nr:hypothetical protein [Bacteroidales bacterium]